jgi:hypothetical protein
MRAIVLGCVFAIGFPAMVAAQESPEQPAPPPAPQPPPPPPPPPAQPPAQAPQPPPAQPPQQQQPPQSPPPQSPPSGESRILADPNEHPSSPSTPSSTLGQPTGALAPLRPTLPTGFADRWHSGRVLYGIGSFTGLLGGALTISSIVVVGVTGYPCDPDDIIHKIDPKDACNPNGMAYRPPSPTDAAPLLAYLGSTTSALGFVLSAAGLGYQHHLLWEVQADIDRGVFHGGTVLGVSGFAAVGLSYFFGLTDYLSPHDQGLAILATSITGTGLCLLGSLLYTIDAGRMKRAWERISTF